MNEVPRLQPLTRRRVEGMGEAGREWVDALPGRLEELAARWGLTLGRPVPGGSASYVVQARTSSGAPRVLKVGLPDTGLEQEARVLAAADGRGYVRLFERDGDALLLEVLGPSLERGGGEPLEVLAVLADVLVEAWEVGVGVVSTPEQCPAPVEMVSTPVGPGGPSCSTSESRPPLLSAAGAGSISDTRPPLPAPATGGRPPLPAPATGGRAARPPGAEWRRDHPDPENKAESLLAGIEENLRHVPEEVRARTSEAVEAACEAARGLASTYQPVVVVHGDPHPGNALRRTGGRPGEWAFVDPDGFEGEREYDLGVAIRDFSRRVLDAPTDGDARAMVDGWAALVAERTGADAERVAAWGLVERVSTGLYVCSIGSPRVGVPFLDSAARLVE